MFGRKKNHQTRRTKHFLMLLLLPKRPMNALANRPPQALLSTPRRKPHGRGESPMAEDGGATSLRGSHIAKEGKAKANNKKTQGVTFKNC